MSCKHRMHPRNIFITSPDYTDLAIKYPSFRKMCKLALNGKVIIDLRSEAALRSLTATLLKHYFDLEVEFAPNSLIPTLPLRLNYVLWIEDIMNALELKNVHGIDIGCGSSCIYALLAAKTKNWRMIALEANATNIEFASENIKRNHLEELIQIFAQSSKEVILSDFLESRDGEVFDFCLCNPPFYDTNEMNKKHDRNPEKRKEPKNCHTGNVDELFCEGGEVAFVKGIVAESQRFPKRVRVFSTMLGHKSSETQILEFLKEQQITNFTTTQFCQGNTTRIHKETIVPKYKAGSFSWDDSQEQLLYNALVTEQSAVPEINTNGFIFKATMNQMEEAVFVQEFSRNTIAHDSDSIVIEDIMNLVLFLAPREMLTKKFINFLHTENFRRFIKALIMYFEYFLLVTEFVLIRRDEKSGKRAQVESMDSVKIKRIHSEYIIQYRIIVAKEYSMILFGKGDMAKCYHLIPVVNISMSILDMAFHESFIAFSTQMVWIAHRRRAYDVIDDEISRLFRSDHFKLHHKSSVTFRRDEKELLYGKHNYRSNFRHQNSPLILELKYIERRNLPILWLGTKKYRGNDLRIQLLEMEVIIPESQLHLADIKHGILGHPKSLYNTILELDHHALREMEFSEYYDPYRLVTQPFLHIPDVDVLEKKFKQFDTLFDIKHKPTEFNPELIKKWKRRDEHFEHIAKKQLFLNTVAKCRLEVESMGKVNTKMSIGAMERFFQNTKKLRKRA